jgi:hypothetical protein
MNGWLSLTGKFFPCAIGQHNKKATELIAQGNTECWIAVHPSGLFSELPPTDAQIKWVKTSGQAQYMDHLEMLIEMQEDYE